MLGKSIQLALLFSCLLGVGVSMNFSKKSHGTNKIGWKRWNNCTESYFFRHNFVIKHKFLTCCKGSGWDHEANCESDRMEAARKFGIPMDQVSGTLAFRDEVRASLMGAEYRVGQVGNDKWRSWEIPVWMLSALFAVYPFVCLLRTFRLAYRFFSGHCTKCSYNLTGNTSGVCPECGTPTGPRHDH